MSSVNADGSYNVCLTKVYVGSESSGDHCSAWRKKKAQATNGVWWVTMRLPVGVDFVVKKLGGGQLVAPTSRTSKGSRQWGDVELK